MRPVAYVAGAGRDCISPARGYIRRAAAGRICPGRGAYHRRRGAVCGRAGGGIYAGGRVYCRAMGGRAVCGRGRGMCTGAGRGVYAGVAGAPITGGGGISPGAYVVVTGVYVAGAGMYMPGWWGCISPAGGHVTRVGAGAGVYVPGRGSPSLYICAPGRGLRTAVAGAGEGACTARDGAWHICGRGGPGCMLS